MEYTELNIWIESRSLVSTVYTITKSFPKEELFSLTNQIRRSSISIPSNIAEGCGRRTTADTIHFLHIARGSLFELETQLFLALDQEYLEEKEFNILSEQIKTCKKLLHGFIKYYKSIK